MKRIFKIEIKIVNCKEKFIKELDEGVISSLELVYDLKPEEYEKPLFNISLHRKAEELIEHLVEYKIKEIE